ncbi:MAG: serine/threonine-protein kinase [Acidobacteriota bacterium]
MTQVDPEIERRALDLTEKALLIDDPSERSSWLEEQTRDDPVVLRRVNELLGKVDLATTLPGSEDLVTSPLAQTLGPYRIAEEIGRGGMGVVYRAHRDDDAFDLSVALKIMRPLSGLDARRFEGERRILARLNHENVARILDGGATPDGAPYLVMELVDGQPVDEYCREQELGLRNRLDLFLQVCAGVAHAHRNLVVHRDIKPANILVTAQERSKLLDFGIAKSLQPDDSGEQQTLFGQGAMTPEYASPEQVLGEPVSVATDVYSLGVVLYELLVGVRPFELSDRSPASLQRVICETDAPSPSSRARQRDEPTAVQAGEIEGDLDTIVLKALRKDPHERYSSVESFAADVRRYLEGHPISARPQSWSYVAKRFVGRHRGPVLAGAIAAILVFAGGATAIVQSLRAAEEGRRAQLEARKAATVNDFLSELLTAPNPVLGMGQEARIVDLLEIAGERLSDLDPATRATMARTLANTYVTLGLNEQAQGLIDRETPVARAALSNQHEEVALLNFVESKVASDQGDYLRELELLEGILPFMRRELPENVGTVLAGMADAHALLGQSEQAEPLYRESIELEAAIDATTTNYVSKLNNLAVFYSNTGRLEESTELLEQGLAISRQNFADHPMVGQLLSSLANSAFTRERNDPRIDEYYRESVESFDRHFGRDHALTINTRASWTNTLWARGRLSEGLELSNLNLAIAEASLAEGHPQLAYAQVVHCSLLTDMGRAGEILETIQKIVDQRREALPEGHFLISSAENLLGASLAARGRRDEAREVLLGSRANLLELRGPDDPKTQQADRFLREIDEESPAEG